MGSNDGLNAPTSLFSSGNFIPRREHKYGHNFAADAADLLKTYRFTVIAGQEGSGKETLTAEIVDAATGRARPYRLKCRVVSVDNVDDLVANIKSIKNDKLLSDGDSALSASDQVLIVFKPEATMRKRAWKDAFTRITKALANVYEERVIGGENRTVVTAIEDDDRIHVVIEVPIDIDAQYGKHSQKNATLLRSIADLEEVLREGVVEGVHNKAHHALLGSPTPNGFEPPQYEGGELMRFFMPWRAVDDIDPDSKKELKPYIIDTTYFDRPQLGKFFDAFFNTENALSTEFLDEIYSKTDNGRSDYVLQVVKELRQQLKLVDVETLLQEDPQEDLVVGDVQEKSTGFLSSKARRAKDFLLGPSDLSASVESLGQDFDSSQNPYDYLVKRAYEVWQDKFIRQISGPVNESQVR